MLAPGSVGRSFVMLGSILLRANPTICSPIDPLGAVRIVPVFSY